jgi:hypothetical protein
MTFVEGQRIRKPLFVESTDTQEASQDRIALCGSLQLKKVSS